VIYSENITT